MGGADIGGEDVLPLYPDFPAHPGKAEINIAMIKKYKIIHLLDLLIILTPFSNGTGSME